MSSIYAWAFATYVIAGGCYVCWRADAYSGTEDRFSGRRKGIRNKGETGFHALMRLTARGVFWPLYLMATLSKVLWAIIGVLWKLAEAFDRWLRSER